MHVAASGPWTWQTPGLEARARVLSVAVLNSPQGDWAILGHGGRPRWEDTSAAGQHLSRPAGTQVQSQVQSQCGGLHRVPFGEAASVTRGFRWWPFRAWSQCGTGNEGRGLLSDSRKCATLHTCRQEILAVYRK